MAYSESEQEANKLPAQTKLPHGNQLPARTLSNPAAPPPVPPIYVPAHQVFDYWWTLYKTQFPGQRPPIKWLSHKSHLPLATCGWYRQKRELTTNQELTLKMTLKRQ